MVRAEATVDVYVDDYSNGQYKTYYEMWHRFVLIKVKKSLKKKYFKFCADYQNFIFVSILF